MMTQNMTHIFIISLPSCPHFVCGTGFVVYIGENILIEFYKRKNKKQKHLY